jgi:selenocysteine lyase/cysteine desulfurase
MTTRRDWVAGAGRLLVASAIDPTLGAKVIGRAPPTSIRDDFPMASTRVCLNNASVHPMSLSAQGAVQAYLDGRSHGGATAPGAVEGGRARLGVTGNAAEEHVRALFASLINASASEISFVPSTTAGENLVVAGLGIPGTRGNVVTDALHFEGSMFLYRSLQAAGLDLRVVPPREWRIDLADLERRIDKNTKLVALSLVSYVNGFQHDLKAVSDLAHAHGAIVYADIVQAAGSVPIDVRATGVDCCATSSYKWLMGDFGLGFLYVREDLLDRVLKRTQYGFRQYSDFEYHFLPGDTPGDAPTTWTPVTDVAGHFEVGTISRTTVAALGHSLEVIHGMGVANIQAHNLALVRRVQAELPRLGYTPLTPSETTSSIASFVVKDPDAVTRRLSAANVNVKIEQHLMRVSPSIFNNDADVDAFLNAVS